MRSPIETLATLPPAELAAALGKLSEAEAQAMLYDWRGWHARPEQLAPAGEWDIWLVLAGRGWGKALALDTPIPTPQGWKRNGDLVAGDVVFDERGAQCRVVAAHNVMIGRPCFRVVFSDGSSIVADAEHLWTTHSRRYRKAMARRVDGGRRAGRPQCARKIGPETLTTAEIAESLICGGEANHSIDCCGPLECDDAALPIDPYLFGCWLGDGHSAAAAITTADSEIVAEFEACGYAMAKYASCGAAATYGITAEGGRARCPTTGRMVSNGVGFLADLRRLGVVGAKRIPAQYLRASVRQRLALLQGLFDTDGYCDAISGSSEYCSTSDGLARDVHELALSMGVKAVMYRGRATIDGRDCGEKFRVCFTAHDDLPLFRLPRKLANQPKRGAQAKRAYRRYIVGVESVPSVPVRCITVDSPSRLYLAGEAMVPTHNTKTGAEWVREEVEAGRAGSIALVGLTAADVRDVMVDALLKVFPPDRRPIYTKSNRCIDFANGAKARTFNATEPDQLRGPQFDLAWTDELAKFRYAREAWDMLQFGVRLGNRPRQIVTTTPRPIELIKAIVAGQEGKVAITRGSTLDNRSNLAASSLERLVKRYTGTRLGRQELNAEILGDLPGALWTQATLDAYRVRTAPQLRRIVVSVDPAVTNTEDSDYHGIIVAGSDAEQTGYVVEDASMKGSPRDWAQRAVSLYRTHGADGIVVEVNQGGDMVAETIRTVAPNANIIEVRATRGKHVRAEPVAALYEQGRIRHVGQFPELESQMTQFTTEGYQGDASPDRADAMVWAMTELMPDMVDAVPDVARFAIPKRGGWMA